MNRTLFFLFFLLLPLICVSQEYVDLFSINYGKSRETSFENLSKSTTITMCEANITIPVVLPNKRYIVISGIDYSYNSLQLFPDLGYNYLYSTRIKAGTKINHSEHWSGTYILLPKISSDFINISGKDFYIGGAIVLKYAKSKNANYKFGIYSSNEAFGMYLTPILGYYYKSLNSRFEMNLMLPSNIDLNYGLTNQTKIGIEYVARGRSFKMTTDGSRSTYTENNSLEFSSYIQNNSINKNVLLRLKMGLSTNRFEVYPIDQKVVLEMPGLKFGDKRTQLNTNLSKSYLFSIEGIYRFDIVLN